MHFSYYMPTKILFGCGEFEHAADWIIKIGKNILLVTGKQAMKALGFTSALQESLHSKGAQVVIFDQISAEPHTEEVNTCVKECGSWRPDVIIALGGGSVIDAAKGIALGLSTNQPVEEYLTGSQTITHVDIPLVAIPTTAGTGSEINWASILTDKVAGIKTSFRHEGFFPKLAIVDPRMTLSLPTQITLETGFDVLAHAMETYISMATNPIVQMYSLEAIGLVRENLPLVMKNGGNIITRTAMMYASMIMGANLANSSTCLPHRLQYPIGVKTGTSHGAGLMVLLRPWIENTYEYSSGKFDHIATALSGHTCNGKEEVLAVYDQFNQKVGIRYKLGDLGVRKEEVAELVAKVTGSLTNDPAGMVPSIVEKIYMGAF